MFTYLSVINSIIFYVLFYDTVMFSDYTEFTVKQTVSDEFKRI